MRRGTAIGTTVLVLVVGTMLAGCVVDGRGRPYDPGYGYPYEPPPPPPPPSRPPPYGGGGWDDRGNDRIATVVCASKGGQSETCRTPFPITHAEVDKSAAASETLKLVTFWGSVLQQ